MAISLVSGLTPVQVSPKNQRFAAPSKRFTTAAFDARHKFRSLILLEVLHLKHKTMVGEDLKPGVNDRYLSQARTVLRYLPEIGPSVLAWPGRTACTAGMDEAGVRFPGWGRYAAKRPLWRKAQTTGYCALLSGQRAANEVDGLPPKRFLTVFQYGVRSMVPSMARARLNTWQRTHNRRRKSCTRSENARTSRSHSSSHWDRPRRRRRSIPQSSRHSKITFDQRAPSKHDNAINRAWGCIELYFSALVNGGA